MLLEAQSSSHIVLKNHMWNCSPRIDIVHDMYFSYSVPSGALTSDRNKKTILKIVSEYDQEIPQSQTAHNPVAPRGRAAQPTFSIKSH